MKEQEASDQIVQCYQALATKQSNVVLELIQHHQPIETWKHYPSGDVKDKEHHSQYYYHAHPSKDQDRVSEHGHFHLFLRKSLFEDTTPILYASKKYLSDSKKDAFCHLAAIAMNAQGYPTALFTVNHWVVQGIWYNAEHIIARLPRYQIGLTTEPVLTHRWITAMVQLFKEPIAELLITRDAVIQEWQLTHPDRNVFTDKELEITSVLSLT